MAFTLQSTINGKYISDLFSDSHEETFQATKIERAYRWKNLSILEKIMQAEPPIMNCRVVEFEYKTTLL